MSISLCNTFEVERSFHFVIYSDNYIANFSMELFILILYFYFTNPVKMAITWIIIDNNGGFTISLLESWSTIFSSSSIWFYRVGSPSTYWICWNVIFTIQILPISFNFLICYSNIWPPFSIQAPKLPEKK